MRIKLFSAVLIYIADILLFIKLSSITFKYLHGLYSVQSIYIYCTLYEILGAAKIPFF